MNHLLHSNGKCIICVSRFYNGQWIINKLFKFIDSLKWYGLVLGHIDIVNTHVVSSRLGNEASYLICQNNTTGKCSELPRWLFLSKWKKNNIFWSCLIDNTIKTKSIMFWVLCVCSAYLPVCSIREYHIYSSVSHGLSLFT